MSRKLTPEVVFNAWKTVVEKQQNAQIQIMLTNICPAPSLNNPSQTNKKAKQSADKDRNLPTV